METVTLTKRGQISVPSAIRKAMHLKAGQELRCLRVSNTEFRVSAAVVDPKGATAALGWAQRHGSKPGTRTDDVMRQLREGEHE